MKQFDVYANPSGRAGEFAPYIVVLSSHLGDYRAVMVAPLLIDIHQATDAVDIPIRFEGRAMILTLLEMAAVSSKQLQRRAGSLADYEDAIRRGLGRLFTGF